MNEDPEIPEEHKPIQAPTVGYWLDNSIYVGDLLWAKHSTDVINDANVRERNAVEDMVSVPGFCEPLVSREIWDKIQAVRNARRRSRKAVAEGKQIAALAPGLTLKYLLTGLVRCGHCGRAMAPSSSCYVTVAGEETRKASYGCPGYPEGHAQTAGEFPRLGFVT